jgi:hypothetical protein
LAIVFSLFWLNRLQKWEKALEKASKFQKAMRRRKRFAETLEGRLRRALRLGGQMGSLEVCKLIIIFGGFDCFLDSKLPG